jgi:lysozyme
MDDVKAWIKQCEGLNLNLYPDSLGITSIGWGRNIQGNGITIDEAQLMFDNDFNRSVQELEQYAWYQVQSTNVKKALINMNFNLGIHRLTQFTKMITALINRDYTQASIEALDSKWAKQVGKRAKDIAVMIRQG